MQTVTQIKKSSTTDFLIHKTNGPPNNRQVKKTKTEQFAERIKGIKALDEVCEEECNMDYSDKSAGITDMPSGELLSE